DVPHVDGGAAAAAGGRGGVVLDASPGGGSHLAHAGDHRRRGRRDSGDPNGRYAELPDLQAARRGPARGRMTAGAEPEHGHQATGTRPAIALTIAGSDSGGGAGIQADLKTFHRFGVFGTSVITAVTAQNTRGVSAWRAVDADLVRAQLDAVAEDLRPRALKSGMLGDATVVCAVADGL